MADEEDAVEIPHDVVNEMVVVAAALVDETARNYLLRKIQSDIFIDEELRAVWKALEKFKRQGIEFAMSTLHAEVSEAVELPFLQSLVKRYPEPPVTLSHHVSSLQWDHARADAVRGSLAELLKGLRDSSTSPVAIRQAAKRVGSAFDVKLDLTFMRNPRALAKDATKTLTTRQNQAVYPFGVEGLDIDLETKEHRIIPGAAPQQTTLITGVSGSGKSVFAAMVALRQARMGRQVLYGAWEMGAEETLMLLGMLSLGMKRYDLSTGNFTDEQVGELEARMEKIGKYIKFFDPPFHNDLKKRYDNDDSLDVLAQQINDSGCDVFMADLWERAIPDGKPEAERRGLFRQQHIAQECNCHQILVCQQKLKEIESRTDKRPTRSTILGSAAWVEIADTILGVHRPKLWDAHAEDTMEVLILKQRFGKWPIVVEYDWDGNMCTLQNPRQIDYEDPTANARPDLFGGKA